MFSYLQTRVSLTAIAVCAMTFAGCASWQGPRIDPTGERLLAWPNEAPPAMIAPPGLPPGSIPVGPSVATPPPGLPVGAPAVVTGPPMAAPLPFGNMQAPPVYSDPTPPPIVPPPTVIPQVPYAPTAAIAGSVAPALPAATVTPAVPIVAPLPGAPPTPTTPPGSTFVRLSPDRLVAPVGSEVFLKAGVAGPDGTLTPNERIEWSVARNGVGQLGSMGLHEAGQFFTWWVAPEKIDPWTAVGRTAFYPISVTGTSSGAYGEAQIDRGESYVTLTSCNEGVSQVTAFAPDLCQFNQATTSIYWIDAQWVFPASVVAECGRPHVLTTTVFRRTNGTPLAGWIVRYTVGTGGSLGYEGGNTIDARTDAAGRASVEVSPAAAGGGVTQIGITIVRPQSIGPGTIPQVELARGAATITWSANAPAVAPGLPLAPAAPSLPGPPPSLPPGPPPAPPQGPTPSLPPSAPPAPSPMPSSGPPPAPQPVPANTNTTQPSPYTPPPMGRPRLEVTLRATTADQVAVGQDVQYELTITNRGDGVARNIKVVDQFDTGLSHEMDVKNTHRIERSDKVRELAPNDSEHIMLDFKVIGAGKQCHEVTVTADGSEPAIQRACATGIQAALEVQISAERTRVVGDVTTFSVAVKNVGSSGAAKVVLRVQFDPAAAIEPNIENDWSRLDDGSVAVQLNRELSSNERRVFRLQARCRAPSTHDCARASVTAAGGAVSQDEACLEILPPGSPPGGPGRP
jgi:uncharacterized repeat protein (TIGR01451 family)